MNVTLEGIASCAIAGTVVFNSWLSYRNGQRAKGIAADLNEVKIQTNGLNAKLLQVTGDSQFAKGLKQGEENPIGTH